MILLMWLSASPAMACLLPSAQLTSDEMACCRHMAGMCDQMAKNTSHSCCVKVRTHNPTYLAVRDNSSTQQVYAAERLAVAGQYVIRAAETFRLSPIDGKYPPGHSPPASAQLLPL